MKPIPYASLWLALMAAPGVIQAIAFDTSGKCAAPVANLPASEAKYCHAKGKLTHPSAKPKSFPAFTVHECAQRCFAQTPACVSFGIQPSTDNVHPGKCTLYTSTLAKMGFVKQSSSTTQYFGRFCFKTTSVDDTPVQDGGFSNSGKPTADPWDVSISGYASTHNAYHDGYDASLSTSYSHEAGPPNEGISQTYASCIGNTYQLTYDSNSAQFNGFLSVYVNSVELSSMQEQGGSESAAKPLYYSSSTDQADLSLQATTSRGAGGGLERLDNVKAAAIFRGSLPLGTVVTTV